MRQPDTKIERQPLLVDQPRVCLFRYGPRHDTDRGWLKAYFVLVGLCVLGTAYALIRANWAGAANINSPEACPKPVHDRMLQQAEAPSSSATNTTDKAQLHFDAFFKHPVLLTGGTLFGAIGLSIGFVHLLKSSPGALVKVSLGCQILIALVFPLALMATGSFWAGAALLVFMVLVGLLLWHRRQQITYVTKLLGTAAHALTECPGVVALLLGLPVVALVAMLPAMLSLGLAGMNGHLVYNPARDMATPPPSPLDWLSRVKGSGATGACLNLSGDKVVCCVMQPSWWVPAFNVLVMFTIMWTLGMLSEVVSCTVAGTFAQWYSAQASTPSHTYHGGGSRVMRSLTFSLTSSLGSLCFSSAVVTIMSQLCNLLGMLLLRSSLLQAAIMMPVGYLVRLAVVRLAITGEGFVDAGRAAVDLVKRKLVDAIAVYFLPIFILMGCAVVAVAAYAGALGLAGWLVWGRHDSSGAGSVWLLAGVAYVGTLVALAVVWALLLNMVYAAFVCTNMESDGRGVTHPHVLSAYEELPTHEAGGEKHDGRPAHPAATHAVSHAA